jgi:hypothetical protein
MSATTIRASGAAVVAIPARTERRVGAVHMRACGEDADLAERLEAAGYRVHPDIDMSVITPEQTQARAPHGFAHHLRQLGRSAAGDCA